MKLTSINNDKYGNPRYVVHYLELADDYETALKLAKKIGGTRYRAKWYGGGIVFAEWSPERLKEKIRNLRNR